MGSWAAALADSGARATLLVGIARSDHERRAIAARSYWHPNGFLKLVLRGRSGGEQLRLHVWPERVGDDDPHDHAWSYRSVVVAGEVVETVYREVGRDDPHAEPMWRHRYGAAGAREFSLDGPVATWLRAGDPVVRGAGERSGGDADRIHRFSGWTTPAMTLVHVTGPARRYSHVFRAEAVPAEALRPRPATVDDVAAWVDHALRRPCPA
jgi:hypothetical protein